MNKEDTIHVEHSGSPERVFLDHQKLKDAIWEVYSEDLKAAQDQDIILPLSSASFRRTFIQRSQSLVPTVEDQGDAIQGCNQTTDNFLPNKEFSVITETNLTTKMERNTKTGSISPQLNAILDFVVGMELKEGEMEVCPSTTDIQTTEVNKKDDINKSAINTGNILKPQKRENRDETNNCLNVNRNMNNNQNYNTNMHPSLQTDEENDKLRLYSKRVRLPGIEQVINKTSFANQRSDYYNRIANASTSNDVSYGTEINQQQFSNQRLPNLQNKPTMQPSDNMLPQENVRYFNSNTLPGRQNIARNPDAQGSNDPQWFYNNPLLNPSVPKSETWPLPNVSQGTSSSLTSPQVQFQNNVVPKREVPGIFELGTPYSGQTSPSVSNVPVSINNNQYQKYNTQSLGGCLPVVDGAVSPQTENNYPPNAMVTRSNPSCPFHINNRPILVTDKEYQNNLHHPLISSTVGTSKLNHSAMHLANVNAQKLGLGSMTQSPYSSNQILSPYNPANLQALKISPTTPPIFATNTNTLPSELSQQQSNFMGQQNFQYPSAGSSTPSRQEFIQHSAGQMGSNPAGVNMQSLNYGPKNQEQVAQKGFPVKNKSQWSGSSGYTPAHYKNLQGFPTPISSPRVQELSSPRTQEVPSLRTQDLPSARHQQFTPPCAQQFTPPCAQQFTPPRSQEYPYTCNQQFPSTSSQEFPSPQGQFAASRPEMHSIQYPQRASANLLATSAMDQQKLNLTNQLVQHDRATAKNYSQISTTKAPRKRRVTKGISVAQTKRIQKKRKQVVEKLFEFLGNEQCNQKTSVIITKHLYHVQSCPNWAAGEDCPLCNQICEMVEHSTECQNLNCPFLYCGINALTLVAQHFSNPKFVYGFLKQININEEEMKDVFVLKHWKDKLTSQC